MAARFKYLHNELLVFDATLLWEAPALGNLTLHRRARLEGKGQFLERNGAGAAKGAASPA
jgi:hypothetical protein